MSVPCPPVSRIEKAVRQVCYVLGQSHGQSHGHSPSWVARSEDELWRELVSCILGSQVRYEIVQSAVERIDEAGLFSRLRHTVHPEKYEDDVINALSNDKWLLGSSPDKGHYPFAKVRARQICQAALRLYSNDDSINGLLYRAPDTQEARRFLAAEVPGIGPKQASLFLRNIGFANSVAVLDAHVLTYMNWMGLTCGAVQSVPTIQRYEKLERVFLEHSSANGFPPDHFDIAVWVVVRVAKKECQLWR